MFTKEQISHQLGQRVMDYAINKNSISFSLDMSKFGFDTDRGWYADFDLDNQGILCWIPDIPTETLMADGKVTTLSELESALEDWGSWDCYEEDED